ncbi:gastrula zinc finger protein XlCGF46.1-like [Aricia agestis]|uniref:gastrula zinc finger protein XlCGF46.1-like n=1 Tax=Aricia agestis TaxID=91739 RepID=UPI001C203A61|nr:gastrula zinc finger protein XlCGF46.1-like [Aricia agestis]
MLEQIVGEVVEEVPGLEAMCTDCTEVALQSIRLINIYKKSNKAINTLYENLTKCLDVDADLIDKNKMLHLILNGEQSRVVIEDNEENEFNKMPNNSEKYFECTDCDKILHTIYDVQQHNLSEHSVWTCSICSKMFSSKEELINHEDNAHKHQCPHCTANKSSEDSLQKHQDKYHTEMLCTDCGKACQGLFKLKSHQEKHKTKSTCPKCGKSYTTKDFYLRHVELCLKDMIDPHPIRSTMQKSFVCEKCDKAYSTPGGLRVHHRFVHNKAKPHVCKECGKEFTAPSYLKIHMVTHTGERNFKCDICSNKFVSKEALLYHKRRHTGEKPYSCKICNEKFVNASARAEHIKFKHVGPTLMCEVCSRKFVTANFLRQHMSRHHDRTSKWYSKTNAPKQSDEQSTRNFIINET